MSDLECLGQIIAHLGLGQTVNCGRRMHHEDFNAVTRNNYRDKAPRVEITLASGGGDEGAYVTFAFDKDGRAREHYVWDGDPTPLQEENPYEELVWQNNMSAMSYETVDELWIQHCEIVNSLQCDPDSDSKNIAKLVARRRFLYAELERRKSSDSKTPINGLTTEPVRSSGDYCFGERPMMKKGSGAKGGAGPKTTGTKPGAVDKPCEGSGKGGGGKPSSGGGKRGR